MNPPAVGDPTGDAGPVSFTLHGGDIAPEPTGSSRFSSGKKMPKVFAGWRFVLAPLNRYQLRMYARTYVSRMSARTYAAVSLRSDLAAPDRW